MPNVLQWWKDNMTNAKRIADLIKGKEEARSRETEAKIELRRKAQGQS